MNHYYFYVFVYRYEALENEILGFENEIAPKPLIL